MAEYTGPDGEIVINTETKAIHIQDGVTPGGHSVVGGDLQIVWDDAVNKDLGTHAPDSLVNLSVKALSARGNGTITYEVAGDFPPGMILTTDGFVVGEVGHVDTAVEYPEGNIPESHTYTFVVAGFRRV